LAAVAVTVFAYLVGSIPFGYLIVKAKAGGDVRHTGSGGTGATNVSRRAGKLAGILTLLLDSAKGAAAVLTARGVSAPAGALNWTIGLAAVAVIVGHIFPVWLGFRGGKGVATAIGVFLVLAPLSVGLAGIVFLTVFLLSRYVSLASILAAVALPLIIWMQTRFRVESENQNILLSSSAVVAMLIVFAHRSNIERLLTGKETKFR